MVRTKLQGLLPFGPGIKLATQESLPAKGKVEPLKNRLLRISLTNTLTRAQKLYEGKVFRRLTNDGWKIINSDQRTSEDESLFSSFINNVVTNKHYLKPRLEEN